MWKEVINYPKYEISEEGAIRSKPCLGNHFKGRELKYSTDKYGYQIVCFNTKERKVNLKVHRLVAQAFIPNPENKPQVNHIDGDKTNNSVSNLEWVTASENIRHAKNIGIQCECPNRKLVKQYTKDGVFVAEYQSLKAAQEATGIGWTGISACTRGVRKTAGGFVWR